MEKHFQSKTKAALIGLIFSIVALNYCEAQTRSVAHAWTATLKAVDDTGQPVQGAEAWVSYSLPVFNEDAKDWAKIAGKTDANGIFKVSHFDQTVAIGFHARKVGYYGTSASHEFGFSADDLKVDWNPVQILVLKRIIHPIAMYARNAQIEIPDVDKPMGYDLMKGDWVAPYGTGEKSDFIFEVHRRWVSRNDFDVTAKLNFANPNDGLIPVLDSLAATAPADGYLPTFSTSMSHTPAAGWKKEENKGRNYYFRVRTQTDERGNVTGAYYGKVYGDFALDPINSKTTWIVFTYYLNPESNSKNLEFDPKQNLFKNLPDIEQVKAP